MDPFEALIPRVPDLHFLEPLGKELLTTMKDFTIALHTVNAALWGQGFLAGFTTCATILTALWCFTRRGTK